MADERLERIEKNLDRLTAMVVDIAHRVKRLERIAGVPLNDEERDQRLTELEGKARQQPQ